MKKHFSILTLVLAVAFSACSKSSKTGAEQGADSDQVMYYTLLAEPEYLDPGLATDTSSSAVIAQLFEGLLDYDPKTLEPIAAVAKSWKISSDAKTYTFSLRKNAKWSNGDPLTAHDFIYSWKRVLKPETAARYAYQLYYIKNAQKINKGEIKDLSKLGVTAIDDYTLRVELENPTPFFLSIAAFQTLRPVHQATVEKHDRRWTRAENMVNNGYFKLKTWEPNRHIILEKNPLYWDHEVVKLDRVHFLPIEDRETALKKVLSGEAHYVEDIPNVKIDSLKDHPEFVHGSYLGTYYLSLNNNKPPFDKLKFRQAINHAIDRDKLVQIINKGQANSSLTPKGIAGYEPPAGPEYDPAKAKKLLIEAGYADAAMVPPITILYNTSENHKMVLETVQSMLKTNLGISVMIENMEWKVLLKRWKSKDFQASRAGWIGDYADPNTFSDLFTSDSGNNHTSWANDKYDMLIKLAARTTKQSKRFAILQEAEALLLAEVPIVPLFTYSLPSLISNKLVGFHHNLQNKHPLKRVSIKEAAAAKK